METTNIQTKAIANESVNESAMNLAAVETPPETDATNDINNESETNIDFEQYTDRLVEFCTEMKFVELPKVMPKLVADLLMNTPDKAKTATGKAAFVMLSTNCKQITFRNIKKELDNFRLQHYTVAESGSGKHFVFMIEPYLMRNIMTNDGLVRQAKQKWLNENSNKRKTTQRPEFKIQILDSNITYQTLVDANADANDLFNYISTEEIQDFTLPNKEFRNLVRFAGDNRILGSDRVSKDGVSKRAQAMINLNVACTPKAFMNMFDSNAVEDGSYRRISVSGIRGEDVDSADLKEFTDEYQTLVDGYIANLDKYTGQEIPMPEKIWDFCRAMETGIKDAIILADKNKRFLTQCGNTQIEIEGRRMMLHFVAMGCDESILNKTFFEYHFALLRDDLSNKNWLFGDVLRNEVHTMVYKPMKDAMLKRFADTFTRADVMELYLSSGTCCNEATAKSKVRNQINAWLRKSQVVSLDGGTHYRKSTPEEISEAKKTKHTHMMQQN